MNNAIELRGVSKSFGDTHAVTNLDLTIPIGSLCGFLGPNGAGKSTTIRMIMSIIYGNAGTVQVFGTTALEAKDRIGYLPEERGVYRKMKVGAFIEYIAKLKGMRGPLARSKVRKWLEKIELPDIHNKRCEELSKGMQQKVQFLAAIIHDPELIILDEPFTGLDPVNSRVIGKIIDELHQDGRTILFSTHVLPQAEKICDRIIMIDQGTKVLDGSIKDIKQQFDPRVIQVEPMDPTAAFPLFDGIASVSNVDNKGYINLRLKESVDATEILRLITQQVAVRGIQIVKPTLDEVFIEQVAINRGVDAASEAREELING
ncbi:MAG: ATP-binding cassette domain-containing protein [Planctomycetota bacterium]|nr:ATP-binding cassette domain-containing protein [Planctomycetota bacterium]